MPARRHFYPPSLWRTGGLARHVVGGPGPIKKIFKSLWNQHTPLWNKM